MSFRGVILACNGLFAEIPFQLWTICLKFEGSPWFPRRAKAPEIVKSFPIVSGEFAKETEAVVCESSVIESG
eukprot:4291505-Amphidinium_carterae.1